MAGCGTTEQPPPVSVEGSSTVESGTPCVAASPLDPASVPPPLVALPPGAVLTDVTQAGREHLVTGRVEGSVEQVLEHFRTAPGFVVSRDEDEGRSGELKLFGSVGDVGVTVARLTCPRGWTSFTISTTVTQTAPSP